MFVKGYEITKRLNRKNSLCVSFNSRIMWILSMNN